MAEMILVARELRGSVQVSAVPGKDLREENINRQITIKTRWTHRVLETNPDAISGPLSASSALLLPPPLPQHITPAY